MSLMFGTVSYLPQDEKLREIRRKAHLKQLEWVDKMLPNTQRLGIYQGWTYEDLGPREGFIQERYESGIGPSRARNKVLEHFYSSEYDWLMLSDDDSFLYDYYQPEMFLEEIANSNKFDNLGIIVPINPMIQPFKKINCDPAVLDKYVFVKASVLNGNQVMFVPNLVRRGKAPVYFNSEFYDQYKGYEDVLFCVNWVQAGNKLHNLQSLIMYYGEPDNSVIYGTRDVSKANRALVKDDCIRALSREAGLPLIQRNGNLSVDTRRMMNCSESTVIVPRKEKIVLTDNLVVKETTTRTSRLLKVGG